MKKRHPIRNRFLLAALFLAAGLILEMLAIRKSGFADTYVDTIYHVLVEKVGGFFSPVPFSVVEIGLYALIFCVLYLVIVGIIRSLMALANPPAREQERRSQFGRARAKSREKRKEKKREKRHTGKSIFQKKGNSAKKNFAAFLRMPKRYENLTAGEHLALLLSRLTLIAGVLFFVYVCGCGINYHATPFSEKEGIRLSEYTEEDLKNLCLILTLEVNSAAQQMTWNSADRYQLPENVKEKSILAMQRLGEVCPSVAGYYPNPKPVAISRILTVQQVTGIYSPFTIEANYNNEMPPYEIPATICHELSHLKGFMREQEAGFIAYLACMESSDPAIRFSGAMHAYAYAMSAYYKNFGSDKYFAMYDLIDPRASRAWGEGSDFWRSYESVVSETHEKVNDTYLKVNRQPSGTRSYGQMVDLLIAWKKREGAL